MDLIKESTLHMVEKWSIVSVKIADLSKSRIGKTSNYKKIMKEFEYCQDASMLRYNFNKLLTFILLIVQHIVPMILFNYLLPDTTREYNHLVYVISVSF